MPPPSGRHQQSSPLRTRAGATRSSGTLSVEVTPAPSRQASPLRTRVGVTRSSAELTPARQASPRRTRVGATGSSGTLPVEVTPVPSRQVTPLYPRSKSLAALHKPGDITPPPPMQSFRSLHVAGASTPPPTALSATRAAVLLKDDAAVSAKATPASSRTTSPCPTLLSRKSSKLPLAEIVRVEKVIDTAGVCTPHAPGHAPATPPQQQRDRSTLPEKPSVSFSVAREEIDSQSQENEDTNKVSQPPTIRRLPSKKVLLGRVASAAAVRSKSLPHKLSQTVLPEELASLPLESRVAELVKHGSQLKSLVKNYFQQVARGSEGLDLAGLAQLRSLMGKQLGIPQQALGNLHDEYVRFDFDGDGMLQAHECYKLVKYHLREYYKKINPSVAELAIPFRSVQSAGYTFSKELGHGSQGVMKLAVDCEGNQRCIKVIRKSDGPHGIGDLKEEFEAMNNLHNEHIAKTYDIFQDNAFYYMVNEPYFGGDFTKLRHKATEQGVQITENWWRIIFRQCFEGLRYLHEKAMMHCDIKEPNLMLKTDNYHQPEVVIIDFGIAQEDVCDRQRVCGTPGYIPPETWETKKWFPKGDCFSLGVTMMQLLIDQVPMVSESPNAVQKMLRWGIFSDGTKTLEEIAHATRTRHAPFHRLPKECPGLAVLIEKLLEKRQEPRYNASQALNDSWFHGPGSDAPLPPPVAAEVQMPASGPPHLLQPRASAAGALGAGIFIAAIAAGKMRRAQATCYTPLGASPLGASPLSASPMAASPMAASPLAASPVAASPVATPVAASPIVSPIASPRGIVLPKSSASSAAPSPREVYVPGQRLASRGGPPPRVLLVPQRSTFFP